MDKKDFMKKLAAGVFFILSMVMIAVVIFKIGVEKGMTQPRFKMTVLFQNIGGLSAGAPVTLSGVNIGTIYDIDFIEPEIEGRGVKVTLNVFKKYEKQLHKSTLFAIKTEGVLGEKIVDIATDQDFSRPDLTQPVIGVDPLDVQDLAETFGDAAGALADTSRNMNTLMREFKKISGTSSRLLNRIEQRLIDGNLFKVF
ncbi:MAG: hypothetical protein A2787_01065 [Omnitrophica WOR_2 bacterium RIFCSPHIGHO2_01_FULL_48_9]|nr:MAG: hypothetical protein A2787_01065 [Omnitrophica WOR_2 bacterium RIFCSPHIGHO2_01_FULL_48_9]